MTQEDKYAIYRQWLDETKSGRKGGSAAPGTTTSGGGKAGGGELHHTLLDEEESNKSTFEVRFPLFLLSHCLLFGKVKSAARFRNSVLTDSLPVRVLLFILPSTAVVLLLPSLVLPMMRAPLSPQPCASASSASPRRVACISLLDC
jgi:hypothetical protein